MLNINGGLQGSYSWEEKWLSWWKWFVLVLR